MIKLQDYTPEIYYKQSRDFQYLGRLYDLVLNAVKTNTDMIYDIPSSDAAGSKMIDLLALTLGFKQKHHYSVKQLSAICSIFAIILRNKGTITALDTVCNTLLHAEGIWKDCRIELDPAHYLVNLYIPQELTDLNLLRDLLDYILPAGMICNIIRTAIFTTGDTTVTITVENYSEAFKMAVNYTPEGSGGDREKGSPAIVKLPLDRPITEQSIDNLDKDTEGLITTSTVYRNKKDE